MELNPDIVAVKIDVKNAFNQVNRESIISALSDDHSLQHMAWSAACQLASEKWVGDWGETVGCVRGRGNTRGSSFFTLLLHGMA